MAFDGPIVVGIDGSKRSARACSWASSVAAASDKRLVVVHAYQVGDYPGGPDTAAAASLEQLRRWMSVTDFGPLNLDRVQPVTVSGHAGQVLVEMAAVEHAALLVIGAPHVGAVAPHGLGKTVQHTSFRSSAPVAIIRGPGGPVATAPMVVGLDPVDCNMHAVDWSFAIAGAFDVPLEVVSVSSQKRAVDAVEHLLEQLVSSTSPVVDLFQTDGDPADELVRRATEIDASAIVVGQKRHHNAGGRLLGHIPSKLVYQSHLPVILLPHG